MKYVQHMLTLFTFMVAVTMHASDAATPQTEVRSVLEEATQRQCLNWYKLQKTQSCAHRNYKAIQHTCTCCAFCAIVYAAHQLSIDTPAYISNPTMHTFCFYGLLGKNCCDCIDHTVNDCYTYPAQAAELQEDITADLHSRCLTMNETELQAFRTSHPSIYKSFKNFYAKKMD